jgi:hypothetical protein
MPLQLRDNVHWCDSGGRAVFLDAEADRYFCLPTAINDAFMRLATGRMQPGDPEQLQMLVERRILVEVCAPVDFPPPPQVEPPIRDWMNERSGGARLLPAVRALAAEISAARRLRSKPFIEVLENAKGSGSKQKPPRDRDERLRAIVSASRLVAYLLREQDRCLVRALAVHSACKKSGIRAKLVFGVIAHPFAAHCWVQLRGAVLVGAFEQARLYTPILVIE